MRCWLRATKKSSGVGLFTRMRLWQFSGHKNLTLLFSYVGDLSFLNKNPESATHSWV